MHLHGAYCVPSVNLSNLDTLTNLWVDYLTTTLWDSS